MGASDSQNPATGHNTPRSAKLLSRQPLPQRLHGGYFDERITMLATLIQSSSSSDAELIVESRRGSREAFGQIVRRYQGMVTRVIYSFCGNFHRSEDRAQETFISALN